VARESFRDFLVRSLGLLEVEKPRVHAALCRMLAGKELDFSIDRARVVLRFNPALEVDDASDAPHVRVTSDRAAILGVLDGLSLEDAIVGERVSLQGALEDLVLFHDALLTYLHGAVRCPSFPKLLAEYRRGDSRQVAAATEPPGGCAP
jgi:hypothetical protein